MSYFIKDGAMLVNNSGQPIDCTPCCDLSTGVTCTTACVPTVQPYGIRLVVGGVSTGGIQPCVSCTNFNATWDVLIGSSTININCDDSLKQCKYVWSHSTGLCHYLFPPNEIRAEIRSTSGLEVIATFDNGISGCGATSSIDAVVFRAVASSSTGPWDCKALINNLSLSYSSGNYGNSYNFNTCLFSTATVTATALT